MIRLNEKTIFFICLILFFLSVGVMVYYFLKSDKNPSNQYELTIDSLNKENLMLDSLYDLEKNKRDEIRVIYKKISIKEELDSLNIIKSDLEKLKKTEPELSDSISADSLRGILIKQFNEN